MVCQILSNVYALNIFAILGGMIVLETDQI